MAVEFRSFSKPAGFTGLRCGYVVIPETVKARAADGRMLPLKPLWNRRQTTKYNGCPYIVQRARRSRLFTRRAAGCTRQCGLLHGKRLDHPWRAASGGTGRLRGVNAPYIWLKIAGRQDSWRFFEALLNRFGIVGTPGVGFGPSGEGYFRLTAFGSHENTRKAMRRIADAGHWSE